MKLVFCKKLAGYLCMKRPPSSSLEPPQIYTRKTSGAVGDRLNNGLHYNNMTSVGSPPKNETADKTLLEEMRDLQKAQFHNEEEQRYEAYKMNEIISDWMLAAAVVDRISAIAISIIYIGSTAIFITVVANHA